MLLEAQEQGNSSLSNGKCYNNGSGSENRVLRKAEVCR